MSDVTLACKDANSTLLDVVTVVDVDNKERVGNTLVKTLKLKFGQDVVTEVWSRFWLKIGQYFELEVWSRF